jgi:hypothetical protein
MTRGWLHFMMTLLLLLNLGCSDSDNDDDETPESAQVRAINLVTGSPALQVTLDSVILGNVSYAQSTGLGEMAGNTYEITVSYLDADGDDRLEIIEEEGITFANEREVTLIVTGSLESARLTVIEHELAEDIPDDSTEIHFFHGSTSEESIALYLSDTPDVDSINGISPKLLQPEEPTELSTVPSGSYRLFITRESEEEVIYDSGEFDLASGTRRLLFSGDYFGPGGALRMVRVNNSSSSNFVDEKFPSAIRVANMIADSELADVRLNGDAVFTDLAFGRISDYIEVPAELIDLTMTLPDQPLAELWADDRQLIAGEHRTLIVAGSSALDEVQGRFLLDEQRRIESGAQINIVNASPGAGNLDVYFLIPGQQLEDVGPIFTNFTLLTNGSGLLEGRTYDLVFTRAEEDTVVLGPERVTLVNSGIYTIIVTDADGGGTPADIVLGGDFSG